MAAQQKSQREPAAAMPAPMLDVQGFFAANQKAGERFTSGALDFSSEMMRFAGNRLRRDLDTWQALCACKTPADMVDVEFGYARTMLDDYLKEASKLMDMATKVGADSLSVFDEHARSLLGRR